MELGRHSYLGEVTSTPSQILGRHRDDMWLIPMGDRGRDLFFNDDGDDVLEERISLDKYSKYRT
jgi:hypothetical protein